MRSEVNYIVVGFDANEKLVVEYDIPFDLVNSIREIIQPGIYDPDMLYCYSLVDAEKVCTLLQKPYNADLDYFVDCYA